MLKKMNLSGLLLAGLMALIFSGCDSPKTTFEWGGRTSGVLVAIVDDSLAVYRDSRSWKECTDVFMYGPDCKTGGDNTGLYLVNYREKKAPLWGDTIDGKVSLINGFYKDSNTLFFNNKNQYGLWKIGEKPRVVGTWRWDSLCTNHWDKYGRSWKEGNILFKITGNANCPYAVLDTSTGIVKKIDFTGENAWLAECDDITYLDGKVVCLQPIFERKRYGVYLIEDNNMVDSLVWDNSFWEIKKQVLTISGNLFTLDHPSTLSNWEENPLSGKQVISVIPFLVLNPFVWLDVNSFRSDDSAKVTYFSEDLFVTK